MQCCNCYIFSKEGINTLKETEVVTMAKKEKKIIKEAWQETKNLKEGEVFLLKDLFKGYKWNRIKMEKRSSLGRLFLEKAQQKKSVEVIEKTSSHQQQYRKLG